jgi:hypothetical protein
MWKEMLGDECPGWGRSIVFDLYMMYVGLPWNQPLQSTSSHIPFIGMASAFMYTSQVSASEYLHSHDHLRSPSPTTSLSPTLVNNAAHYTERPSLKLTIPSGASNILNSVVVSPDGQSFYTISSNSKRTTLISCEDNVEVATVQWDRSSPRMVFRRKKMKCKAWLSLTGPENEYALPVNHGVSPNRI